MRPFGEHRRALHTMSDPSTTPPQSHRAYQYLLLIELLLTIVVLALSVATIVGLL